MSLSRGSHFYTPSNVFTLRGNKLLEAKFVKENRKKDIEVLDRKTSSERSRKVALDDMKKITDAMEERLATERGAKFDAVFRYKYRIQAWEKKIDEKSVKAEKEQIKAEGSIDEKLLGALRLRSKMDKLEETYSDLGIRKKVGLLKKRYIEDPNVKSVGKAWIEKEKIRFEKDLTSYFRKVEKRYANIVEKSVWNIGKKEYDSLQKFVGELTKIFGDQFNHRNEKLRALILKLEGYITHAKDDEVPIVRFSKLENVQDLV